MAVSQCLQGNISAHTSNICDAKNSGGALLNDAAIVWQERLRARSRSSRRVAIWEVTLLLVLVGSRLV